ncbi:hypothetical protein F7725_021001 [Dissostichus mawsoni]|uniref:Uncharacterized protein n=1 Tax=Dissostichus mawsoni TaxID=36200 RepID=A0A7J5YFP6_DISMA|nr:hypothetical protein F7725_021001 [Dissostichus mawsoni]
MRPEVSSPSTYTFPLPLRAPHSLQALELLSSQRPLCSRTLDILPPHPVYCVSSPVAEAGLGREGADVQAAAQTAALLTAQGRDQLRRTAGVSGAQVAPAAGSLGKSCSQRGSRQDSSAPL